MTLRDAGIEAVIFDWGGTLSTWATSVSTKSLWGPAAEALAPHVDQDAEELTALLGAAESDFWERTEHEHPYGGTLAGIVAEAQRRLGADVPPSALDAAAEAYLDAWAPHIKHDAEAAPTLEALRERGLRTAMLSNTHWPRHFHERFLRRDGLDGLLDARLYTCELDYMKPHPSVFGAALAASASPTPRGRCSSATGRGTTSSARSAPGCAPHSARTRWSPPTTCARTSRSRACRSCSTTSETDAPPRAERGGPPATGASLPGKGGPSALRIPDRAGAWGRSPHMKENPRAGGRARAAPRGIPASTA